MTTVLSAILYGRLPVAAVAQGWFGNAVLSSVLLAVVIWWLLYTRLAIHGNQDHLLRSMLLPAAPLLLGATVPVVAIYVSDVANHYFFYGMVHLNQPKSLTILLLVVLGSVLLQSVSLEMKNARPRTAAKKALEKSQEPLTVVLLLAMGILQAAAYIPPPGQDFLRYWMVADAMGRGLPYAANTTADIANQSIGMTAFIIDLPLYPAMMATSFVLFGHTVAAAYLPIALGNAVLPLLTYLFYREFFPSRSTSISLASIVVLFPLLRFYTLNFPVPDSIFLAALMSSAWLFVRIVKRKCGTLEWLAFGVLAAAMALVRTEGVAYSSLYVLGALVGQVTWRQRALALVAYLAPIGVFSFALLNSFGTPWPRTFAGALGVKNLPLNIPVLVTDEFFTSAIRLSSEQLAVGWTILLILALGGSLPLFRRSPRLAVLVVPAWANLLMVLLADPRVSGARLWFDFFRHVSYVLPMFVLGAAVTLTSILGRLPGRDLRILATAALDVMIVLGVLWNLQCLSRPSWSFGPDAVNLVSQERTNLIDFVGHPYQLPTIEYELAGTHSEPKLESAFFSKYPDPVSDFYAPFDAVKLSSGAAYEAGSLLTYLAALLLAVLAALPAPQLRLAGSRTDTPSWVESAS